MSCFSHAANRLAYHAIITARKADAKGTELVNKAEAKLTTPKVKGTKAEAGTTSRWFDTIRTTCSDAMNKDLS